MVDLLALALLVSGFSVSPQAANVPSLLAGVAAQFVGNKWFAFGDESRDLVRQGAQFAAVEAGALTLNAVGFHVLVEVMPYGAARLVTSALVYFGFSYPLWTRIFRRTR